MKYTCDQCHKEVDDNGPYERADGEYECQGCMESRYDKPNLWSDRFKPHKPFLEVIKDYEQT